MCMLSTMIAGTVASSYSVIDNIMVHAYVAY
jgi:hypothetical protein